MHSQLYRVTMVSEINLVPRSHSVLHWPWEIWVRDYSEIYSYFEKGCRKKPHATIPKGIVGGFQFTVFQTNFKGHKFASAKGKH